MTCQIYSKCVSTDGGLSFNVKMEKSSPSRDHIMRQEIRYNFYTELKTKDSSAAIVLACSCCAASNSSHILVTIHLFCLILLSVT